MTGDLIVYGAYGYTGRLVVERAVEQGLAPTVAGRDPGRTRAVADDSGLGHAVFPVGEAEAPLADVDVLLNCAGPFVDTHGPLVDACLATDTDYLDVTGEVDVFESIAARDGDAREAGVTLLPGVGFDVVPTDSVAAHLLERLPGADELALAFRAVGGLSPGTAHTAVRSLGEGGLVRRDGDLRSVALCHEVRRVDFGDGATAAAAVPWGDVSTAYHTTGVGDVTVYTAMPVRAARALRAVDRLGPVVGSRPVRAVGHRLVDRYVEGPTAAERETGHARVWGEATDGTETVVARLETPETYEFTRRAAVSLAERVLAGEADPGFETPAGAFGPAAALDVDGVRMLGP
jgi:short subunit dehydrogenase-like uncharacterized protein